MNIRITGKWVDIKNIYKTLKKNNQKYKIWKNNDNSWTIVF